MDIGLFVVALVVGVVGSVVGGIVGRVDVMEVGVGFIVVAVILVVAMLVGEFVRE